MNRSTKRNAPYGLWWLILCFLLLPACQGSPTASSPADTIRVAYPKINYSTLFVVALGKGYFLAEGLEIKPQAFESDKLALQALLDGQADLAISADTPVVVVISSGQPISIIAQVATARNNEMIIARKDRGIAVSADLAGKTIGVPFGTSGEYFLDSFLSLHGIARSHVTRKNIDPSEMSAALAAGTVDAVSVWNPWNFQLQLELADRGVVFTDENLSSDLVCLIGQTAYLADHPQAIDKFLRGLVRAEAFAKQDPAEGQRIVSDALTIAPELITETWVSLDLLVSLDQTLLISLENQTRWAQANQIVGGTAVPNYLDFLYFAGLDEVRPASITIIR